VNTGVPLLGLPGLLNVQDFLPESSKSRSIFGQEPLRVSLKSILMAMRIR